MRRALGLAVLLAACGGGGSSSKAKDTTPEEKAPPEDTSEPERTGAAECDALIARTYCTWSKAGDAVPAENRRMFADAIPAWREALQNPETRQATIDACMMSLDAGYPGYSAVGCWMVGDDYDAYQPAPPPEEEEEPAYTVASTGNAECDDLIAKTMCMYEKTPGVPGEAIKAFQDGIAMWTEALHNDATKQAVIDACKMSLEAGMEGFQEMGCW